MRAADTVIEGKHFHRYRQCLAYGLGLPTALVELVEFDSQTVRFGAYRDDIAGVISNQVAAWNPGRQRKLLPARIRLGNRQCHLQEVRSRVRGPDSILDGVGHEVVS